MFRGTISTAMLGALAAAALAAAPLAAQYHGGVGDSRHRGAGGHRGYGYGYGYDDRGRGDGYYRGRGHRERCDRGSGGTIIGAIAGGLLGNTITGRGDHAVGTIAGAGVGALAGRSIDRDC